MRSCESVRRLVCSYWRPSGGGGSGLGRPRPQHSEPNLQLWRRAHARLGCTRSDSVAPCHLCAQGMHVLLRRTRGPVVLAQVLASVEERERRLVGLEEAAALRRKDMEREHTARMAEAEAAVRRLQVCCAAALWRLRLLTHCWMVSCTKDALYVQMFTLYRRRLVRANVHPVQKTSCTCKSLPFASVRTHVCSWHHAYAAVVITCVRDPLVRPKST